MFTSITYALYTPFSFRVSVLSKLSAYVICEAHFSKLWILAELLKIKVINDTQFYTDSVVQFLNGNG